MKVSIIAAVSTNGVIGRGNGLPWRQSTDLKRLKALTVGHHYIQGRKTYDTVGRPLPGRVNVVITRQVDFAPEGIVVVHSLEDALHVAEQAGDAEAFVAGGAQIFEQSLHVADRMYITRVHAEVEGDTFFPPFDRKDWGEHEDTRHPADARHEVPFRIVVLERPR